MEKLSKEEKNRQVNGYVGFDLFSVIKLHKSREHNLLIYDIEDGTQNKCKKHHKDVTRFLYFLSHYLNTHKFLIMVDSPS